MNKLLQELYALNAEIFERTDIPADRQREMVIVLGCAGVGMQAGAVSPHLDVLKQFHDVLKTHDDVDTAIAEVFPDDETTA